jgi:chromosomal replication initiator protein
MSRPRRQGPASGSAVPFLVLDENRLAWTGIQSLITARLAPSDFGRCVLIYGPAGCGKSHLCDVLIRELTERKSPATCERLSAAELREVRGGWSADATDSDNDQNRADEPAVIEAVESAGWLRRLSQCDLVIVEEIHQLVRHTTAQQLFRALFDTLRQSGTDLVITSLQTPGDLKGLQSGIANRIRGGLCTGVKRPGLAARERLLGHFCSHLQIAIPLPVLKAFAKQLVVSPRELLGTLLRFDEVVRQQRRMPDLDLARAFLRQEILPAPTTIEDVAKAVAREFGVRLSDMRSTSRDHVVAVPRQCAMYLARELTGEHLATIGEYFSGRSHSTVLHACSRIAEQIDNDAALRQQIVAVKRVLNAP